MTRKTAAQAGTSALASLQRVEVGSREELRRWLAKHHRKTASVWLVTARKTDPARHVTYDEIVEEALAHGWVDSLPRALDAGRTMRLLSPRKRGSAWSATNKARVEKLIAAGRMTPAGLAKVEAAKADGSWGALDAVETLEVPPDLRAAFARHRGSAAAFAGFPPSSRRLILEWITQARKADTRARRVEETAEKAARGQRANHWRQPGQTRDGGR